MPPKNKKKGAGDEEDPLMKAARFGRVKNTLTMGFGRCNSPVLLGFLEIHKTWWWWCIICKKM